VVTGLTLRSHQEDAVKKILNLGAKSAVPRRAVLEICCGGGKTLIEILACVHPTIVPPSSTSVIVVPSLLLVQQLLNDYFTADAVQTKFGREFKKMTQNAKVVLFCGEKEQTFQKANGLSGAEHIKYLERLKKVLNTITTDAEEALKFIVDGGDESRRLVITTFHSCSRFAQKVVEARVFLWNVVFDEAHRICGELTQETINYPGMAEATNAFLSFTATLVNSKSSVTTTPHSPFLSNPKPRARAWWFHRKASHNSLLLQFLRAAAGRRAQREGEGDLEEGPPALRHHAGRLAALPQKKRELQPQPNDPYYQDLDVEVLWEPNGDIVHALHIRGGQDDFHRLRTSAQNGVVCSDDNGAAKVWRTTIRSGTGPRSLAPRPTPGRRGGAFALRVRRAAFENGVRG
jgi:hypothetical protein